MKRVTRFVKRLTIRKSLILSYLLLILIAVVSSSFLLYKNYVDLLIDQTNTDTFHTMNELNGRVESVINEIVNLSFYLTINDNLRNDVEAFPNQDAFDQIKTENDIIGIINQSYRANTKIANVNVIIRGKKYVSAQHNSVLPEESVRDTEWFRKLEGVDQILLDTQKTDYSTFRDDNIKDPIEVIPALSTIKNSSGQEIGYLMVDISEDYIYDKILGPSLKTDNMSIFLVNNQGTVISAKNKSQIGKPLQIVKASQLIQRQQGGCQRMSYQGKNSILIYTDSSNQGWRVVGVIPTASLYIHLNEAFYFTLAITLLLILCCIPLTGIFSNFFSKPIIEMAAIMRKFRTGNIKQKIVSDYTNEIGELQSSYNIMLDRIDDLMRDISLTNEKKRQADIRMLQAQINPHFLYNTLDSISWSAIGRNAPEISNMLVMLSNYFRLSLNRGRSCCPVSDEISNVKYYMELYKVCFCNNFDYSIEVQQDCEKLWMPKLVLQPLIENSIVHGFEGKSTGGRIRIHVFREKETLIFDVADNGCGIPADSGSVLPESGSQKGGVGLRNVQERIHYLCSDNYGIRFYRQASGGALVRTVLPAAQSEELLHTSGNFEGLGLSIPDAGGRMLH